MDEQSNRKLRGVHPDLQRVLVRAEANGARFRVIEGLRTLERQKQLLKKGATTTLRSRHLDGHAVDIVPLDGIQITWAWPAFYPLAKMIKQAAKEEGVPIEWGGDWKNFKDGPHWQLPWKKYPSQAELPEDVPAGGKTDKQVAVQKASLFGSASGGGAALSEMAGQISAFTEYSEVLKWIFVGLMVASILYGIYAWVKERGGEPG